MEDAQIVQLYWDRRETAIEETDRVYGGGLRRLANNILPTPEDGEECVSDTYWQTWNAIPPNRPLRLFAFLARICRNLAFNRLDRLKAQKRSATVVELTRELELCIAAPDDSPQDLQELGELLTAFLRRLPEESRRVFLRRYWYADSVKQIAERYRISESKVKTLLFRARNQLRDYLEKEGIAV